MRPRTIILLIAGLMLGTTGCVSQQKYNDLKADLVQKDALLRDAERAHRNIEAKLRLEEEQGQRMRAEYQLAIASKDASERALLEARSELENTNRTRMEDIATVTNLPINQQTGGLMLESRLMFNPGKAELRDEGKATLNQIALKIMTDYPHATIRVAGHTDDDPIVHSGWADNWQLSVERARVVLTHLIEQGITREQMYLAGYAETLPFSARKEENRRVELILESEQVVAVPGG